MSNNRDIFMKLLACCLAILLSVFVGAVNAQGTQVNILEGSLTGWWFPAGDSNSLTTAPTSRAPTSARPTVVSLHGCGGAYRADGRLTQIHLDDAQRYNAKGWNWLVLDSFTAKGFKSICEIPLAKRPSRSVDRAADAYAALQWLAKQPNVDVTKLAILGRSHGAGGVVIASSRRTYERYEIKPAASIALYPGCVVAANGRYELAIPMLMLLGAADNWTPAEPCQKFAQAVNTQKGPAIDVETFADSQHGFDSGNPVRERGNIPHVPSGKVMVGGNPAAKQKAEQRIIEFLTAAFGT
jgi:dienelactone hydrolase